MFEKVEIKEDQGNMKETPKDFLDFNLMVINPEWGKDSVNNEFLEKLNEVRGVYTDPKTNETFVDKQNLWNSAFSFFTRDFRLANLTNSEFKYCLHYTDLSGDFLQEAFNHPAFIKPFARALKNVSGVLELSQSKLGFLRKQSNTLTQEHHYKGMDLETPKKNILTGKSEI